MQKRLGQTADRISPAAFHRQQVSTVGRRQPVTVAMATPVDEALQTIRPAHRRPRLVTDGDRRLSGILAEGGGVVRLRRAARAPAGRLDSRDVLESIAGAFPQEILNLPPRPHQLMEHPEGA